MEASRILAIGGGALAVVGIVLGLWFAFGRGNAAPREMPANFRPPIPGPPGHAGGPAAFPNGGGGMTPQPGPPGGFPQPGPPGGFPR